MNLERVNVFLNVQRLIPRLKFKVELHEKESLHFVDYVHEDSVSNFFFLED